MSLSFEQNDHRSATSIPSATHKANALGTRLGIWLDRPISCSIPALDIYSRMKLAIFKGDGEAKVVVRIAWEPPTFAGRNLVARMTRSIQF